MALSTVEINNGARPGEPEGSKLQPTANMAVAAFEGSFAPSSRPTAVSELSWYKDREYFFGSWLSPAVWRAAAVELVATAALVYISGMIAATLFSYETKQIGAYIAISNIVLIPTFVYATAPASGGHLNPMITFSAMLSGICPIARGTYYISAQLVGSALAGGVLLGVWGEERTVKYHGGGCFYDLSYMTTGQVFLNEVFGSAVLLFLAYGVGLDPRQAALYGPRMGPVLVGASLAIVSFATSSVVPGYAGTQMHPGRCFGFGIARRDMTGQWIWWFGPAIAAMFMAFFYNVFPPFHNDASSKGRPTLPRDQSDA